MIPSYGIDTVYAASTENAYVIGNYHGRILQVQSGATNTILAMSSITLHATGALDISTGSTALNFILDKQNNLPLQYQSTENSFSFAPVIISTGSRCDVTTDTGMIDLTKAVKNAYNHTPFTRISDYSTLLSASSDYDFAQL